ncbi:hypothetical protein [Streptomyces sp. YKOK-I1]
MNATIRAIAVRAGSREWTHAERALYRELVDEWVEAQRAEETGVAA